MRIALIIAMLLSSGPGGAQVLDERSAKAALFAVRGHVVQVSSKLSERDQGMRALIDGRAIAPTRALCARAINARDCEIVIGD